MTGPMLPARSTAARETAVRSVAPGQRHGRFRHGEDPRPELDPVAAQATGVARRRPEETDRLGRAAHRHPSDSRRPDRVADELPLCVDDAEAEPEPNRQRLAQVPDGVGRANRVRARVALGDAEDGRGRRRRGDETVVLVDAIGDRPDVVGGGSPRDTNDPRRATVGRGEARGREGAARSGESSRSRNSESWTSVHVPLCP